MRIIISLLMVLVLIAAPISGCDSKKSSGENKKEKVTIALWGNQMLENYVQYICDTFPEVDFEFVLATNSTDYYRYRQDHNDMPDILSVRRFALKDERFMLISSSLFLATVPFILTNPSVAVILFMLTLL